MVKNSNGVQTNIKTQRKLSLIERLAFDVPKWIGTPLSLIIHTFMFGGILALSLFGFDFRSVNIVLTTWLSIEAIYLAIFIQMTVNRNTESIEDLQEDVEDIQEDVEDLEEGISGSSASEKLQKFLGLKH